jgi:hypothetical protein
VVHDDGFGLLAADALTVHRTAEWIAALGGHNAADSLKGSCQHVRRAEPRFLLSQQGRGGLNPR